MANLERREEEGGTFDAETDSFSLVVRPLPNHRQARFLVFARQAAGNDVLIGSGTNESISAAMKSAEYIARRSPVAANRIRTLVLLVDDNEILRTTVAEVLRDDGYQVAEATTAKGALRRLERTNRQTVVVSDIDLGCGMTRLELAAAVHKSRPEVGVVLMSGSPERLHGQDIHEQTLEKPFSIQRLGTASA